MHSHFSKHFSWQGGGGGYNRTKYFWLRLVMIFCKWPKRKVLFGACSRKVIFLGGRILSSCSRTCWSRAGQMLVITGAFQFEVHVCTSSPTFLYNTCILPRRLSYWWYPSPSPDRSLYPGGLEEPTSWSGSLQTHIYRPAGTGGGADCTKEPGGTHQTHYYG